MGEAVRLLQRSVEQAQEARMHGRASVEAARQMWALHRLAGVDSDAEQMVMSRAHGESALSALAGGDAALAVSAEQVLRYVREVAPNLASSERAETAPTPDPGELSVPRRRGAAALRAVTTRVDDVGEAATSTTQAVRSLDDLFRPAPDTMRPMSVQPGPAVGEAPRPAPGGDPVVTATVLLVVATQAVRRAARWVRPRLSRKEDR